MVGGDGVDDLLGLTVLLGEFGADESVGPLDLMVHCFTHIVEKTDTLCIFHIETQFGSHAATQERHLDGMMKDVLGIACSVLQFAHKPDEFRMDPVDTDVEG